VKKLRVGFASIEDASSVASWSGIPLNVLRTLQKHPDVEVELISPLATRFKWLYLPCELRSKITKEQFDWKREEWSLRHFATQIERVFRAEDLDVIFSTSSIPGTRLSPEIPSVFWTDATFHSMLGYYNKSVSSRTLKAGCTQEEAALARADFACYASSWAANGAKEFVDQERVKVLPFGPNLTIEHTRHSVEAWIQERRAARPKSCILLFVGIGWERKGGATAVEATRQLNEAGIDATLRVVGSTPAGPVPAFVESVGFLNKREPESYRRLVDLYRTSDIFILPSRAEAFGVVVAEAAAFGLPALVCETGGLADTVREGITGFRLPLYDDGTMFAERAKLILGAYDTFADNAYMEFEDRLNWEKSVDHLVALLRSAAERRH
jgi:Glycosyl transferases group 1